jgi:hypothetical protein
MAYNSHNHNIYVTNFGSNDQPGNSVTRVSTTSNVPDTIITSALDDNGVVVVVPMLGARYKAKCKYERNSLVLTNHTYSRQFNNENE